MSLLVVSLYLPNTIDFNIDDPSLAERFVSHQITRPAPYGLRGGEVRTASAASEAKGTPKISLDTAVGGSTPQPIPNFIKSLASRITSAQNTPPASPPLASDGEEFFFKQVLAGTSPGADSSFGSVGSGSPAALAGLAAGIEPAFSRLYVDASRTASGTSVDSDKKRFVTQPKSRASSPPPAKHLVQERVRRAPDAPSLRVALRGSPRPPASPISPAAVGRRASATSLGGKMAASWGVGNGGLRNAIARAEAEGRRWIGTLGMPTDALDAETKAAITAALENDYENTPGHYTHYCKEILWPTLHYQIPDNAKSKAYEDHSWAFADTVVRVHAPGDTVWVHDYHLMLVPGMIGFFLHIAFPSSEVYRCLPTRKLLLEGILGANVTQEYARHFRQTCSLLLGLETTPDGVFYGGRFVPIIAVPIGIDPPSLRRVGEDPEVLRWRQMIRDRWPDRRLIVGRDKLDQFRGVRQKLLGYETFLNSHPDFTEEAVLIQVCLTNIASLELESDVSDIVTRINSTHAHVGLEQPVVFLHQDISFEQYIALLFEADAFVVTSLREGMNLTCHEYIFCQQGRDTKGALILSEFTGSASVLGDESLLVNPWDKIQVGDAFATALAMPDHEKNVRWQRLFEEVTTNTCATWVARFLDVLDSTWAAEIRS
ncbi:glycosyltransferase family 20-domain-containing protein [Dipodascopsis tothii]|uniref:glycosyltransferase family 20-domain-containing protein n=1 Tax=Dipodascopsis tothii TaxID=44089 RepID=UPI0034CE56AC